MKITDTPRKAVDKIQIDIVGPLPVTENGNKYILTVNRNYRFCYNCSSSSGKHNLSICLSQNYSYRSR